MTTEPSRAPCVICGPSDPGSCAPRHGATTSLARPPGGRGGGRRSVRTSCTFTRAMRAEPFGKMIRITNLYSYTVSRYGQSTPGHGRRDGRRCGVVANVVSAPGAPAGKGLRAGSLGLISSVVIAVSSTAPAYSMAATLGLIVAVVGVHSPGTLIVSFLPMLCIAFAFRELNKADPDCGTTFTWTARAFGPAAGWMGGWGIIAADIIVMASLSQIAGRYFLELVGVAFIALLTWVCYRGIEVSARLQQILLVIEVGALTVFAVVALVKAATGHALPGAAHPSAGWLNPWTGSFGSLSNSFLLAVFIYWGWDCALSVNEETKDSARTPGRAAVMATVMLVAIFAVISAASLAYAGPAFLAAHSTDVLGAMASSVLGSTPGK